MVSVPLKRDPEATRRMQEETAKKAWVDLKRQLTPFGRAIGLRVALLRASVSGMKEAIAQRELTRFNGMRVRAALHRFVRDAGERMVRRGCRRGE